MKRRSGAGWVIFLLLLVGGGVAGYFHRERLLPLLHIAIDAAKKRLG
jgi:hypothetical protein